MSQPCAIISCKGNSRAICHCCQQNVRIQHLNEHKEALNSQLDPLVDQLNTLAERLRTIDVHNIVDDCRENLEQWENDCHTKIDEYFEKKYRELDRLASEKLNEQREDITQLQSKVADLIRDQEATQQNIETFTSTIRLNTCPLFIDEGAVQFEKVRKSPLDLSNLAPAHKTIEYPVNSRSSLTSSEGLLLTHQAPNLCFLDAELKTAKQVVWPHGTINRTCWSSTFARFIILTKNDIFLVDENTMAITKASIATKQSWFSCTCFNDQLFLSTDTWGSSLVEAKVSSSITVIREWKSPVTCAKDELIDDIGYRHENLLLLIRDKVKKSLCIELRSSKTLDRLWSLLLSGVFVIDIACCCCSIDYDGWLVAGLSDGCLLHVTTNGKVKQTIAYESIPRRITQFDFNILVVATEKCINFHKI